jgi:hypothetical protein
MEQVQTGARFVADDRGILPHGSRKRKKPETRLSPADAFLRGLSSGPLASSLGACARFGWVSEERSGPAETD